MGDLADLPPPPPVWRAVLCGPPVLATAYRMQSVTRRRTDRRWEAKHGQVAWYVQDAPPLPAWVPRLGLRRG